MSKSTFASLRNKSSNIDDLKKKFESLKGGGNRNQLEDETFWTMKHLRGENGKGVAVIRLLPAPPDGKGGMENDPFVYWHEYQFRGKTGKWYINRSPITLGQDHRDPAYEYNGEVFQMGLPKEEQQKRLLQRNTNYVYSIQVISDPNKPENEGKVFRWKIGPQLHKIVESALFPEFGGEPLDVFDPINGANLEIRVYTKKIPGRDGKMVEVPSYEKSEFQAPSPLCDLEEFDDIWNQQLSLAELVAPETFKSYEQLLKEFNAAMGTGNTDEEAEEIPAKETKKPKLKPAPTVAEDEIPWDKDPEPTEEEDNSESDSDSGESIDDWLNSLKS